MRNGTLTVAEIESQYPDQWVLVVDPQTDPAPSVLGGTVAFHSHDRDEVYRKAIALRPKRFAFLFTGRIADDTAFAL